MIEKRSNNKVSFTNLVTAYSLCLVVFAADQMTKLVVENNLIFPRGRLEIISFWNLLNLVYIQNPGAAWGILPGFRLLFISAAVAVCLGCIWVLHNFSRQEVRFPLALLLAGGMGNMVDRLFLANGVVDFVDLGVWTYRWPAFNLADAALSVSVLWLIKLILINNWPREDV